MLANHNHSGVRRDAANKNSTRRRLRLLIAPAVLIALSAVLAWAGTNAAAQEMVNRVLDAVRGMSKTSVAPAAMFQANGPACSNFINRTTANGLGTNNLRGVYASGSTVYVASTNGLAISTNGGATFVNRTTSNGLANNNVGVVYAEGNTVYAATISGLSISTDGGATFTTRTTANGLGSNTVLGVYAVGSTVYVSTGGGISISTDGGATFTNRTTTSGLGNNFSRSVYAVGTTIYAATDGGLSISTNGGMSFTNKTTTHGLGNNLVLSVYAVGSTIYAGTQGGFSISTNGGTSFTNRTTTSGLGNIYVPSVYAIGSTVYAATASGISISTDGGTSFTNYAVANGLGYFDVRGVFATATSIYAVTGDGLNTGGLAICPPLPQPEINLKGNSTTIASGDTTPAVADGTDFGSAAANTGAVAQSFTIENTGTGELTLTGTPLVALSGTNASDFRIALQPSSSVAASGSTTFLVNFAPTATGTRTATITIANNDEDENPYTFAIRGTGTTAPANGPACANFSNRTTAHGLGNNFVNGVHAVGSNVYAATNGGLSISTNGGISFANKTTADGLGSNNVNSILAAGSNVYAATNGGLSISTNGGSTFSNRTTANGLGSDQVRSVHAVGSTVYAATTAGLSISTDGGTNFTNKTTANGLGSNNVRGIYVLGSAIYAATDSGLSISTDGGVGFTNKTTVNGLGGNDVRGVYAAGTAVYAATTGGLSISTDSGATFTNRTTAQGLGNNQVFGVYALSNTVYAATGDGFTGGGLSISTDGGATFTNYNTANGLGSNIAVSGVFATATAVYAATGGGLSLCPPPVEPDINVKGNSTVIANGSTTPSTTDGTDFGSAAATTGLSSRSFTIENTGTAALNLTGSPRVALSGANASDFSVTVQPASPVAASGSTTFFVNFVPTATGLRTATVTIANDDVDETSFTFAVQGTGTPAQANGPVCTTFTNQTSGLGSTFVLDVFAVGNTIYAATFNGGLAISTDGGATFTNRTTANGLGSNVVQSLHVAGTTVYAGTQDGLSISTDGGNTFVNRTTANGLGHNQIVGLHVEAGTIYAATNGGLGISTNGGTSFINKTTAHGLPTNFLQDVYVQGNTIYVATLSGISISPDGGTTFINRTTAHGLGSNEVYGIYAAGNKIYAANLGGLSISTDGGNTFTNYTFANGLGGSVLSVRAVGNIVYAATTGGLTISTDGGATFTNYTTTSGLGANNVRSIFPTATRLYVATGNGVSSCSLPAPEINVKGNSTTIAAGDTTPGTTDGTDFGSAAANTGANARSFTIENTGNAALNLSGTPKVTLSGANASDFSIAVQPTSPVAVAGSTTFLVNFAPTATGVRSATVSIANDDEDENPYTFAIQGTGTPAPANGSACTNFANRTTANGLGHNSTYNIYAVADTVYVATNNGLSISTDGGRTFTNKTTANGLGSNSVRDVYAVGATVYAATLSGLSISTDGGSTFTNKTTANGLGNNTVREVYAVGATVYAATDDGLSISTDGGAVFTNRTTANGLGNNGVRDVYVVGATVYAATVSGLSISTDGGAGFTNKTTANGLGNNSLLGVYAAGSTVYAATSLGLSISTDGGASFTNRTTSDGLGDDVVVDVYALGNTVYAITGSGRPGTGGGLSISTNGGTSFTNYTTTSGLGSDFVRGVFATATNIYVATNGGVSLCPPPLPEINVKGNSTTIAGGDTTPSTADDTDFGSVNFMSGTVAKTFTIENIGAGTLNLTGTPKVALSGTNAADFSVTTQPTSPVAVNGSTTFVVTFDPSATGTRTATVSIANDDADENPYTFAIQGAGVIPEINVKGNNTTIAGGSTTPNSTDGTDFGNAAANLGAVARYFVIENTGTEALNLTGTPKVALSGANVSDFSVALQPISPVTAGGSTTVLINFAPTAIGLRTATVSIANNDTDENPYTFTIQGTGTAAPANGPACGLFTNKTTADGLGSNFVRAVYAVGNTVYVGTNGFGLAVSTDGGATFTNRTTANGLGSNQVLDIRVEGSTVYAATGNGVAISTDGGNTFTNRTTAQGLGANFVFGIHVAGNLIYAGTGGGLSISTDGGASFTNRTTTNGLGSNGVNGVYVLGSTVYAATNNGLSISTDGGITFTTRRTADGLGDNQMNGVYVVGSNVYAATADGLSISTNGGTSFTNRTTANGLGGTYVRSVFVLGNTVYAGTNGGFSISVNGGTSFTNYTTANGLGNNQAYNVFATTMSVYAATDGGVSFCSPIPEIAVKGNSTTIANGDTTPSTTDDTDFGLVNVTSGSVGRTFTIENTGTGELTLSGSPKVALSGTHAADFSVMLQPTSPVAPNASTTFTILFDPSAGGRRTATVSIVNDDADENPYTFAIQGNGDAPPNITPVPLVLPAGTTTPFAAVIANVADAVTASGSLTVQINNASSAALNGVSVNLSSNANGVITALVTTTCSATTATFTLTVTDGSGQSTTASWTVTVTANTPPTVSYGNQTVTGGATPGFGPSAFADNGSITGFALQSITPAGGLSLNVNPANGQVTVTGATIAQTYAVVIRATDNCGATTDAQFTVNVVCPTITFDQTSLPGATVNTTYNQSLTASPAGGNYTFAVTGGLLPQGLTLNSNGTFSGAPLQTGTFNFRVTASGFGGCSSFYDYVLNVACAGVSITTAGLPNGSIGTAYNQTIAASPAGSYNFAVTSGTLPPGLTLNASTGVISGTPTATGSFNFTVTAGNGDCSGSRSFTVAIACAGISLSPSSLPAGQAGVAYSQTISVTPAGSYSFSISQGALPTGLTLNTQTGLLSGTPATTGAFTFTLKALAGNGCENTAVFTLTINCPTVSLSPTTLPNGDNGTAYSQSLSAAPAGGNYTYAVTAGSLPTGLNLNAATGILSGTPTANGSSTFTVTATGFGGCAGSRQYTVQIGGGGGCPNIKPPATLPNSSVGQLYSQSLAPTPTGSYTYALTSGSLPPGLTLYGTFGLLLGYPTTTGTYNFTITATNANNCTGSQSYSLLIGGASAQLASVNDFSGDNRSDFTLWRAEQRQWLLLDGATGEAQILAWGQAGDTTASGDYDGDGKADLANFGKDGHWRIRLSGNGSTLDVLWGLGSDVPVPGDYDGDGKTDIAVWRGAEGNWYIRRSSDGQTQTEFWGSSLAPYNDTPLPGDYDGDGKADIAVFRRGSVQGGHWFIRRSSDGAVVAKHWGLGSDTPMPGDYDGDGKTDIAVWRGSEGNWYVVNSSDGAVKVKFWGAGYAPYNDTPAAGDYDGDGKTDFVVWRQSEGRWYVLQSSDGTTRTVAQGKAGDLPAGVERR